eukprot:gene37848-45976_t
MALVNVLNMTVLDNPSVFSNPFQFEITFECLQDLSDDLEWKVVYVGSAEDSSCDQVLEEVMVGPVTQGLHKFVLQTNPPSPAQIKNDDLIGVTVVLVTCSYLDQPFVQIGYYVNNEYEEPFEPDNYPNPVDIRKLRRVILADQPRVTRYPINWTGQSSSGEGDLFPTEEVEEQEQGGDANENEEDGDDGMEDEDEEEDSEEDEDGDDNEEIDLEEEDDEDGPAQEAEVLQEDVEMDEDYGHYEGMEILASAEDSNSIDIGRMMEK